MSSPFVVREHVFDGQHIRQYAAALSTDQEDVLQLHAKSYTPREVEDGSIRGDFTVIAYHANAFPKECYEPFFETLYSRLKFHNNLTIGSIWIADQAFQNKSAGLNDERLGNDFHWWDHSRDILQMVNVFRKQMRRPIIAIGHSAGATQAVMTAHYHPRLFEAIIMIDPPMTMTVAETAGAIIKYALSKPSTFDTREAAADFVRKDPFFGKWEPEPLQRYIDHAFRESPTVLHPEPNKTKPFTNVHLEIRGTVRPNMANIKPNRPFSDMERHNYPDISLQSPLVGPVYNPQTRDAYANLKTLRPTALFIHGEGSKIVPEDEKDHRVVITGTEVGGNGGEAAGNVTAVTIPGGHMLPQVNVTGTAVAAADWIGVWMGRFRKTEDLFASTQVQKTKREKQMMDQEVEQTLRKWDGKPWRNHLAEPDGGRSKL
ncbi:MAG: hypothetical protein GOMPHAMPRED_004998 [Gomphillus americanus]|uniref:AB hydrolase-1 domain-containing protein n=1 Tax=Gomphillus americanus TaxID=1940652 RepID=A0A8H3EHU8_9LECA|nr:MAG: hypothetical protein GOMPHAMPRED_004998 [Gomphillus americanus]